MTTGSQDIREQVWRAVDPTGKNRQLINAAIHGRNQAPDFLRRIGVDVGEAWGQLASLSAEYRASIERIESAVRVLCLRGWAVMALDTEAISEAVALVEAGRCDEADELLADQWEGDGAWRLKRYAIASDSWAQRTPTSIDCSRSAPDY
jgi:hypothetical protein